MKTLIDELKKKYELKKFTQQNEFTCFVTVSKKHAVPFITHLRDVENFTHLSLVTAVDRIEEDLFQITYILHNYQLKMDLGVRVFINRNEPVMESIHHLWKQAATYQRELKEMFGIDFPGSPGVDESLFLEGWDNIPPMRRDFDTRKYVSETYFPRKGRKTHDPATYMRNKLYPTENSQ